MCVCVCVCVFLYVYMCVYICMYMCVPAHWPNGLIVYQWLRRLGFNPRLSHTKDSKNGF